MNGNRAYLAIIGSDFATDAGLDPNDAIFRDTDKMETIDPTKKNIIAARREDADNEIFQQIVAKY